MPDIPASAIDRLIRKGGAERVSNSAIESLRKEIEAYSITLAKKAVDLARYAGHKTITDKDIELAIKSIKNM